MKDWFESEESGRWLIVYDNADDLDLLYTDDGGRLSAYFPRSACGSILMTTRNRQVGVKFATAKNVVTLEALNIAEAGLLMAAKLGHDDAESSDRDRLAETLGRIPLALVQAISFIQENEPTSIKRYLELYDANEANRIQLLSQDFEDDTRDATTKNPIAATWAVTFEYLKEHQPLAADALCLMSVLDGQAISETIVTRTTQGDPPSPLNVERALGTLQAYSLITLRAVGTEYGEAVGRIISLHRLMRLVTRNWLIRRSERDYWLAEAIETLGQFYKSHKNLSGITSAWLQSAYLPHALALLSSSPLFLHADDDLSVPAILEARRSPDDHPGRGIICHLCTAEILDSMYWSNGPSYM